MDALKLLMQDCRQRVDKVLDTVLPPSGTQPSELHSAMRYSTFNGGKRIRPVLVYLAGKAMNIEPKYQDHPASAVELIHCYSLVHDDMPVMDDDDLRRGKPTCHKYYSDATALLTGDALQTLAFEVICKDESLTPEQRLKMLSVLTRCTGSAGMAGGQAIDLAATGNQLGLDELKTMHELKTGALIRASIQLGALTDVEVSSETLSALDLYARKIGLSFQIKDDILDVESNTETLGKQQGADLSLHKATYPALLGLDKAKEMARQCHLDALDSLAGFDQRADPLRWLSEYIITRNY